MMDKATLLFVRHGESEGNRDRVFTHSPEVPITERGKQQAEAAARLLRERFAPRRLLSSPYRRARQTADVLAAYLGLPVEEEEAFRERSFGEFAGRPYDSVLTDPTFQRESRWTWRPPGGESLQDVTARVVPVARRLAREAFGTEIVVVSHGGVMLALAAHATGTWNGLTTCPNGGILVLEFQDERFFLKDTLIPTLD